MQQPGFAYGDQIALPADGLHALGAGAIDKRREPEILALPDLGHRQSIHSGIGELRQQVRRRNDGLIESVRFRQHAELIERLRLIFRELA